MIVTNRDQQGTARVSYSIDNCNFTNNQNYECHFHRNLHGNGTVGLGGGATFRLSVATDILITDSTFFNNSACTGGGVHIYQRGRKSDVKVNIVHSTFFQNHARLEGGGMYAEQTETEGYQLSTFFLGLQNSSFSNNNGEYGGGLCVFNGNKQGNVSVMAQNTFWTSNTALLGGFGVGLSAAATNTDRPNNHSNFYIQATFNACNFLFNGYNHHSLSAVGSLHLRGTKADLIDTFFWKNAGTALYVHTFSYAGFAGNNSFDENWGNRGAAVYVDSNSLLGLREGTLKFRGNNATIDGGAIYVEYSTEDDKECVFESLRELVGSGESINVSFASNMAGNLEQSIFIGNASGCLLKDPSQGNVTKQDILLFDRNIFTYSPDNKTQIASSAKEVNITNDTSIEVMPGENFYLFPKVRDMFGNDASQYGNLVLVVRKVKYMYSNFQLVGPRYISMDDFTKNNELSIKASEEMIGLDELFLEFIYRQHITYHDGTSHVQVKLTLCKLGYSYSAMTQQCECDKLDENLVCATSSHKYACIRYGYWYGRDSKGQALLCPGENCYFADGKCPIESKECPDAPGFCNLKVDDGLCWKGRSGVLCSECKPDHSFSFSAVRCVPSHTCSRTNTALFVLGLIAYWIVLVIFFLFILNVELSIGSGVVYGIMYYFSVIEIFTDKTVTFYALRKVINSCVAITQLCPRVFGDIHICFVENWRSNLQHQLFHYSTPIAVIVLIIAFIFLSRFCRCPKSISPAQNSPIHAMCILILASYNSLTYTSFEMLRPIQINGEWRAYADPDLHYFSGEHLPYALVALFIEVFLSLPICFLILCAPCLCKRVVRSSRLRLKFKPIVDEFQACYRSEYRWFAGFYFLARQLIFVVNILPLTQEPPEDNLYLHTINAAVFIIHCTFQPYKLKWLNLLDALLLADLIFLSFFRLEYLSNVTHWLSAYVLILLPALYLAILVVSVVLKRFSYCFQHFRAFQLRRKSSPEIDRELPSNLPSHTSVSINEDGRDDLGSFSGSGFFRDSGEREPLLYDSKDSGRSTYSTGEEEQGRTYTTSSIRVTYN